MAAALAMALAGCSNYTPSDDPTTPSEQVVPQTDTQPPGGDMLVRVSGTVVAGDGPNCMLLDTGTNRYALVGGDPNLIAPDEEVTVTGTANQSTPTSCAEGMPLTVTAVEATG
jgi:hypothetical protein